VNPIYTILAKNGQYSVSPIYAQDEGGGLVSSRLLGNSSASWDMRIENQHRVSVRADKQGGNV